MQGSIPANTQLQTSLRVVSGDENNPAYVELAVQTINDTVVRSVIIFAEGDLLLFFFCIIETFLREWFRLFALLSFLLKVIFYYFCMYNRDIFKGMFYIHCFLSTEHEFSTKSCLYYYRKLSVSRSQVALRLNFLFEFLKLFNFTFALFFCLFLF